MSRDIRYVKVGNGKHPRIIVDSTVMAARDAAITLAGLEAALAAALREAGRGRCLRCGRVEGWLAGLHASGPDVVVHCGQCGGVLAPVRP